MALITVSGAPGCRPDAIGRLVAQRLGFDFLGDSALQKMVSEEFGESANLPARAWPLVLGSIVARLAIDHHLVIATPGAELLFAQFPARLRVFIHATEGRRTGSLMIDRKLDRAEAKKTLQALEAEHRQLMKQRFGRAAVPQEQFDLVLFEDAFEEDGIASLIETAVESTRLVEQGLLSTAAEAQYQFQFRLKLAKHGITPPGNVKFKRTHFGHPSEEIFANLLDFYRIAWEYEARSFPVQWDRDGKVLVAFTPDFYLPEFDLYVELTTMKQAHVTRKNRKVKLLKQIYPHVNIKVFYQKDIQNLIFKHGLPAREITTETVEP